MSGMTDPLFSDLAKLIGLQAESESRDCGPCWGVTLLE